MFSYCAPYAISALLLISLDVDIKNQNIPVPETAIHAEQLALKARREIKTAEMTINSSLQILGQDKPVLTEYKLSFDDNKMRVDSFLIQENEGNKADLKKKVVFTPDYFIDYTPGLSQNGRLLAVRYLQNATADQDQLQNRRMNVFDPKLIGIVPFSLASLYAFSLDETLGRPDRTQSSITETDYEGSKTWKIEYTRKDGIVARLWIVPSMNFSVVRSEQDNSASDGDFTDIMQCTMSQSENNLWYPEKVNYKRVVSTGVYAGKTVEEEQLEITNVKLNSKLDPEVFSMASMDIPSGRQIFEYPSNPQGGRIWDGNKIIVPESKAPRPVAKKSADGSSMKWFLISINLSILAAILIIFLFRRIKNNTTNA